MKIKLRRVFRYIASKFNIASSDSVTTKPAQLKMYRLFRQDEQIPLPDISPKFNLVHYEIGMERLWVQLFNEGNEFGKWNEEKLQKKILSRLVKNGGVLVLNRQKKVVACSAMCIQTNTSPLATLMNVFVLPQYRGNRLSHAMILDGLNACYQAGIPGVVLLTDDFRLAAIATYLNLGFMPDETVSIDASVRWRTITEKLKQTQPSSDWIKES